MVFTLVQQDRGYPSKRLRGERSPSKMVVGLFEALLDASFVQQLQHGALGDCHPRVLGGQAA